MDLFSTAQIICQNGVGRKKTYLACDGLIYGKLKAKLTNSDANLITLKHLQMWVLNASIHVFYYC